ncbi:MAG: hypothetical protein WCF90_10805 [Methanomicrobiales archaeon]
MIGEQRADLPDMIRQAAAVLILECRRKNPVVVCPKHGNDPVPISGSQVTVFCVNGCPMVSRFQVSVDILPP